MSHDRAVGLPSGPRYAAASTAFAGVLALEIAIPNTTGGPRRESRAGSGTSL